MSQLTGKTGPVKRASLGKPSKLSRAEEYKAALAAACRLSGQNFLVRALPNTWASARLGLIASRKAAPRSVDRNRGKRLAREAFRAARAQLPAVDIVLQQKNDLRKCGNPVIRKELDRLLIEVAARFGCSGRGKNAPPVTVTPSKPVQE